MSPEPRLLHALDGDGGDDDDDDDDSYDDDV